MDLVRRSRNFESKQTKDKTGGRKGKRKKERGKGGEGGWKLKKKKHKERERKAMNSMVENCFDVEGSWRVFLDTNWKHSSRELTPIQAKLKIERRKEKERRGGEGRGEGKQKRNWTHKHGPMNKALVVKNTKNAPE